MEASWIREERGSLNSQNGRGERTDVRGKVGGAVKQMDREDLSLFLLVSGACW